MRLSFGFRTNGLISSRNMLVFRMLLVVLVVRFFLITIVYLLVISNVDSLTYYRSLIFVKFNAPNSSLFLINVEISWHSQ